MDMAPAATLRRSESARLLLRALKVEMMKRGVSGYWMDEIAKMKDEHPVEYGLLVEKCRNEIA